MIYESYTITYSEWLYFDIVYIIIAIFISFRLLHYFGFPTQFNGWETGMLFSCHQVIEKKPNIIEKNDKVI